MTLVTTTDALARFCAGSADSPYVTVDTEFLRERTYYAQLCLVQLARPGEGEENAILIDALAEGLSLEPLYALFRNRAVTKVFHAARQDLEIFATAAGVLPEPFFDTQVAAMVCGYGDQVGYETLVRQIARAGIDKSSRFTDWSRRPLSEAQKAYALADVTHLRRIYEVLAKRLEATGRAAWVEEELAVLTDPATYRSDPADAWMRIKTRSNAPRFIAALRELARLRETLAIARDVPRNRILKDDALLELAANRPRTPEDLGKSRLLLREARRGEIAEGILAAIAAAEAVRVQDVPRPPEPPARRAGAEALGELLRVLLKARAEVEGVAQRLIASSADLDRIASEEAPEVPAMAGWRFELFGRDALRLKRGEIALSADGSSVRVVELAPAEPPRLRAGEAS
ncbi:MAG TPA: ribonuclease D [Amaricoccus sp.]|uniref:ribonuclease D n=1 Tax=Amaricoccus sp. TaxID=1872485 RepID=UPI002BB9CCD5|nr:ribonuclease D [Amaricoccus sp.]HMQ94364.1 ribonuclease D [Amaricoccus sp.]HMR51348.1 ribonuclease D [Amaricoccus sp.]HMR59590.1 ribonuclease D [Amaricoccus sp.]HMT98208.1 ribonuclease D [Amaricoccus sp.]